MKPIFPQRLLANNEARIRAALQWRTQRKEWGRIVKPPKERGRATWNREPLFHISSPLEGWQGLKRERHHDYIDPKDFPNAWWGSPLTVEVEAKAKELALARLQRWLDQTG